MTVWVTKYALSRGILKLDAEVCDVKTDGTMVRVRGNYGDTYYHRQDWSPSESVAFAMAEVMRKKKIASLEKQLKAMKALKFKIEDVK